MEVFILDSEKFIRISAFPSHRCAVDLVDIDPSDLLSGFYSAIGSECELVETVDIQFPGSPRLDYLGIIDEEGRFHDDCHFNELGACLYAGPIYGSMLISKIGLRGDDPDIVGLSADDIRLIFDRLPVLLDRWELKDSVTVSL